MAPAGSQKLWVQDLAPVRRCGTEVKTGPQGQEEGSDHGKRDRDRGGNSNGNGDKSGEGGGERR